MYNWDNSNFFRNFLYSLSGIDTHKLILDWRYKYYYGSSTRPHIPHSKSPLVLQSYLKMMLGNFFSTRQYSFFFRVHETCSRIDYFFVDKERLFNAKACTYNTIVISNHSPLVLELSFPNQHSVYSWWLNLLLLSDEGFYPVHFKIDWYFSENKYNYWCNHNTIWES